MDGFAGPGEYVGGEEGSPLVAIRALCEHGAKIGGEVIFYFVESRPGPLRTSSSIGGGEADGTA